MTEPGAARCDTPRFMITDMLSQERSSDDPAMDEVVRTYRFDMTISVEAGHIAQFDPEWAADAAASALTDGYGISAYYDSIKSVGKEGQRTITSGVGSERGMRSYRFSITFEVDPEHLATTIPSGRRMQRMERSPTRTASRPPTRILSSSPRSSGPARGSSRSRATALVGTRAGAAGPSDGGTQRGLRHFTEARLVGRGDRLDELIPSETLTGRRDRRVDRTGLMVERDDRDPFE